MSKISFIYFDVGGVVIKDFSDSDKWREMQKDLGVTSENQVVFDQIWASHRKEICLGYDVDNYLPTLREHINSNIPSNYSMLQDFVDRFEPNPHLKPLIAQLRSTHKVGLLTNMYPRMLNAILARPALEVPKEWDVIVDSSVVMAQKPDQKIFEIGGKLAGVDRKEILFIDNQMKHLEAAKEFGWQTFYYDSSDYERASHELAQLLSL